MAALAYALLPVSGLVAFLFAAEQRVRFHGAQAIVFGTVWALLLYGASAISPTATVVMTALGIVVWLVLIVGTAVGRDPSLPGLQRLLP